MFMLLLKIAVNNTGKYMQLKNVYVAIGKLHW